MPVSRHLPSSPIAGRKEHAEAQQENDLQATAIAILASPAGPMLSLCYVSAWAPAKLDMKAESAHGAASNQ